MKFSIHSTLTEPKNDSSKVSLTRTKHMMSYRKYCNLSQIWHNHMVHFRPCDHRPWEMQGYHSNMELSFSSSTNICVHVKRNRTYNETRIYQIKKEDDLKIKEMMIPFDFKEIFCEHYAVLSCNDPFDVWRYIVSSRLQFKSGTFNNCYF